MNPSPLRWLRLPFLAIAGLLLAGGFALACSFVYLAPSLPTARSMRNKELAAPLSVYTSSGDLICRIGEERRIPVNYEDIPPLVRHAVLAAEDDRFFEHHGLDWMGVARALIKNVISANASGQGGSTITQQAARNMFLTLDKNLRRKLSEVFITYRMERDFTKEEILAVYLNVAVFGNRSRGIAAAAETYYNKHLDELTVSQAATLIGLLPAPSNYNPVKNPRNAEVRRNYVLGRMTKLGYINEATEAAARKESVRTRVYAPIVDVDAPYVCEMARQELVERFGPAAVNTGYRITTTIDGRLQAAANRALIGLIQYDRRHGYRGRLGKVQLPAVVSDAALDDLIAKYDSIGILQPAVVTKVSGNAAEVHIRFGGAAKIDWNGLKWAQPVNKSGAKGAVPGKAADVVAVGDVIFVVTDQHGAAELGQLPRVQTAMVALDPDDGGVVALVGGFDFYTNKFNRAKQAQRQAASGFKPFLYSAALENGFTPASIILDSDLVSNCANKEECWYPDNSGGGSGGPTRLREALVRSLNKVSRRIVDAIGVDAAIEHATKFGFRKEFLPRNQTLALGTGSVSPLEMATAYATFANGGFKVDWYLISRIEDSSGKVVKEARPKLACTECEQSTTPPLPSTAAAPETTPADTAVVAAVVAAAVVPDAAPADPVAAAIAAAAAPRPHIRDVEAAPSLVELARAQGGTGYLPADRLAPRVISAQNAWLMSDIMHDVCVRGTCRRTNSMGRDDLAGKTGTNEDRDNWFNGFTGDLVASVWVGFDDEKSLGKGEDGSRTALPIWMLFMEEALRGLPSNRMKRPGGLVDLRVSPTTGELADQADPNAVYETFMLEHLPKKPGNRGTGPGAGATAPPDLF